jgi:hypothetical protein
MFGGGGSAQGGEGDGVKRILTDNNPYILIGTGIISVIHTVLQMMAFKNGMKFTSYLQSLLFIIVVNAIEIQFWREKKSMEGLSLHTIYLDIVCSVIILLYLLDNDATFV